MDIGIQPSVPRQLKPSTMTRDFHAAGTSSFGMSGTNAHLMLNVLLPSKDIQPGECSWQRTRRVSSHNAIDHEFATLSLSSPISNSTTGCA